MSLAISASSASLAATAAAANLSAAPAASKAQPPTPAKTDTVQLTEAQQVDQLYSYGYSVPHIASSLNLTAQAVDRYLNIASSNG